MKDHIESKLQMCNIDMTRVDQGFKVQRLHKDFLAQFWGMVNAGKFGCYFHLNFIFYLSFTILKILSFIYSLHT